MRIGPHPTSLEVQLVVDAKGKVEAQAVHQFALVVDSTQMPHCFNLGMLPTLLAFDVIEEAVIIMAIDRPLKAIGMVKNGELITQLMVVVPSKKFVPFGLVELPELVAPSNWFASSMRVELFVLGVTSIENEPLITMVQFMVSDSSRTPMMTYCLDLIQVQS